MLFDKHHRSMHNEHFDNDKHYNEQLFLTLKAV